jgi:hypothetical protein
MNQFVEVKTLSRSRAALYEDCVQVRDAVVIATLEFGEPT